VIEQVIANFKAWRIMHTGYRRPRAAFTQLCQLWFPCISTRSA